MRGWFGRWRTSPSWWNETVGVAIRLGASLLAMLGMFAATTMLYDSVVHQQALLASSVRTSGWVTYQATIEYSKAISALELAADSPEADELDRLELRLEILGSRMNVLYGSEDGSLIPDIKTYTPDLKRYEALIGTYADKVTKMTPHAPELPETFKSWIDELNPLGLMLQKMLMTSVAYNDGIYAREQSIAGHNSILPLALIFLSGGVLFGILLFQGERDRRQLRIVLASQEREAVLRESLRAALDAMPVIVVIFDPQTDEIAYASPPALATFDPALDHPGWAPLISAIKEERRKTTPWGGFSITVPVPKGNLISVRGAAREIVWDGRPQLMAALADTTKIRDAELQVLQASKLATLGEMSSAIAHELNQPLAVISMAVANALRLVTNGGDTQAIVAKLSRINEQLQRARRITDQVRRHGRMPAHTLSPFAVASAIRNAIGFVAEQYRVAGIRLDVSISIPQDVMALGEHTMFEQVIVNLLVNARDALSDVISEVARPVTRIEATASRGQIVIAVQDNAGGIKPEIMDRLFDPFTTTKPSDKGTGLGLSISRTVVREMNGTIDAANVGGGARFTVVVPIAEADRAEQVA